MDKEMVDLITRFTDKARAKYDGDSYYEDYHKNVIANKSMTREDFAKKFWEIVDDADYINLEF